MNLGSKLKVAGAFSAFAALSLGAARAADPVAPRIGPGTGVATKVERALASLPEGESAALRSKLSSGELAARDALHALLLARVPGYASAVAAFDRDGSNVEDWRRLAAAADGPLARTLVVYATYFEGRAHLALDEFDLACQCFDRVRRELAEDTTWAEEATFYLGYVYARRPEMDADREKLWKARARRCLETLAPEQVEGAAPAPAPVHVPERDREAAVWLLRELRGEGSGPLLDLAHSMESIGHSLDHGKTGRGIQKRQEDVVANLDRLIELLRERG